MLENPKLKKDVLSGNGKGGGGGGGGRFQFSSRHTTKGTKGCAVIEHILAPTQSEPPTAKGDILPFAAPCVKTLLGYGAQRVCGNHFAFEG